MRTTDQLRAHQKSNSAGKALNLELIRQRLDWYEETYGIRSDCLGDAIEAGQVKESDDVSNWAADVELLQRIEPQNGKSHAPRARAAMNRRLNFR